MPLISLKAAVLNFKLENNKMKIEDFAQVQELEGKRRVLKDSVRSLRTGSVRSVGVDKNSGGWSAIPLPIDSVAGLIDAEITVLEDKLRGLGVEL